MEENELIQATKPHYNQLREQSELRDNDTIDDKQLRAAQKPVMSAADAAVKLKLAQEYYRAKWEYKDTYKADKWAHRDKKHEMRITRRELVKSRKEARKAARDEKRREKRTAKKAARDEKRRSKQEQKR